MAPGQSATRAAVVLRVGNLVVHVNSLDAINAEPVLKKHEATLKAICEDFAANGTY